MGNSSNEILLDSKGEIYSGNHFHPIKLFDLEFVAYEKYDNKFDVYIFSDKFLKEVYKNSRIDLYHIYLKSIDTINELEEICDEVMENLVDGFKIMPFFKEYNSRRICGQVYSYLKSLNCDGMNIIEENNFWLVNIRKKDFDKAEKIISGNIK